MLNRRFGSRLAAAALTLAAATFVVGSTPAAAQAPEVPQASPKARVEQQAGVTTFTVEYSSPAVKGRKVWGELVPMNQVWRTGANEATRFTATRDFSIAGTRVPAGTYSLFTIPGDKSWTVVLNSDPTTWGAYGYDQKKDVARVEVKPTKVADSRERLAFVFSDASDAGANLDIEWEKVRVRVPLTVDTKAHVTANIEGSVKDAWQPHYTSARWLLENDGDLKQALQFVETSIAVKPTWSNQWVKAQILGKTGKKKDAVVSAKAAQKLGEGDRIFKFYADQVAAAIADWD